MRKITCTLLLIPFLSACGNNRNAQPADYLSENVRMYSTDSLTLSATDPIIQRGISRSHMQNSLQALQAAFRYSYIGYQLKKQMIGQSGDEIFTSCGQELQQLPESMPTFAYYDFISKCLGKFLDSHINIEKSISSLNVTTGIHSAVLIDDKLYIARIRPNLIKKFEERARVREGTYASKLKVGYEITSINGQPPLTEISRLKPYISASSEAARINYASQGIFSRSRAYPAQNEVVVKIRENETSPETEITLPWVQLVRFPTEGSLEARRLLSQQGILNARDLSTEDNLLSNEGAELTNPVFKELTHKQEYHNADEDTVLITGYARLNDRPVCYAQLYTFSIDTEDGENYPVKQTIGENTTEHNVLDVLRGHLTTCETFGATLIFDLRHNGGGDSRLAQMIYNLFETNSTTKTYSAKARLVEPGNASVLLNSVNQVDAENPSLYSILSLETVNRAIGENQPVTDWILVENTVDSRSVFTGPTVILTGPDCVSACEITASRFQKAGRARIIGLATDGTGFGFQSAGNAETVFSDPLQLFRVKIPNFAFQTAVVTDDSEFRTVEGWKGRVLPLAYIPYMENQPVQPDVTLALTVNDLKSEGANPDYLRRLGEILAAPQEGDGPTP